MDSIKKIDSLLINRSKMFAESKACGATNKYKNTEKNFTFYYFYVYSTVIKLKVLFKNI